MKTKIIVEIETKDDYDVHEDPNKTAEDYTPEELKEFREKYAINLHDEVVNRTLNHINFHLGETLFDEGGIDDSHIEGWDDIEDYEITITATQEKLKPMSDDEKDDFIDINYTDNDDVLSIRDIIQHYFSYDEDILDCIRNQIVCDYCEGETYMLDCEGETYYVRYGGK